MTFPVFELAGLIFTGAGIGLLVLGLMTAVLDQSVLPGLFKLLTFVFIFSGALIAYAWLNDLGQMDTSTNAHERDLFHSHVKSGMAHWVELVIVFLPQVLWIPQLREKPFAVMVVAGLSLLPLAWIFAALHLV